MSERHTDIQFEPTDIQIGPVVGFLGVLGGSIIALMIALWGAQSLLIGSENKSKEPHHPLAAQLHGQLPPEPRIEGVGPADSRHSVNDASLPNSAANVRASQETQLRDGWTDSQGKKHPPITEAIKALVAKHAKAGQKTVEPERVSLPSDSSSGRVPRGGEGSP